MNIDLPFYNAFGEIGNSMPSTEISHLASYFFKKKYTNHIICEINRSTVKKRFSSTPFKKFKTEF